MTEFIINHLWQSTLCVIAAALLSPVFRKDAAHVRFVIWLAASIKFLIPFSLLLWAGNHINWLSDSSGHSNARVTIMMDRITQPATLMTTNFGETPLAQIVSHSNWNLWTLTVAVWLIGSLVLICFRISQALYVFAIAKNASPLDVDAPIPVRETGSSLEPGLFGIVSPTLLLPAGVRAQLSAAQLEAIVTHELCHWRRGDNLTAATHMLVETLFWFHPLVWWVGRQLNIERERACDEVVIQSGCDRQAYAEGILRICQRYVDSPSCSAGVSGGNLRKRIEEIMTKPVIEKLPFAKKGLLGITVFLMLATPIALGIGNANAIGQADTLPVSEMKRYSNAEWHFEIDVPSSWIKMPPNAVNSSNEVMRFFSPENGNHGLIIFRNLFFGEKTLSLKEFTDRTQAELTEAGFSNFVLGEAMIGARPVATIDFESRPAADGSVTHCRHYLFTEGRIGYVLGFGTNKPQSMFALFDRMAKSFAFAQS
jgi:beta-lactamase regulating signal transducer with metallopeptidase domain